MKKIMLVLVFLGLVSVVGSPAHVACAAAPAKPSLASPGNGTSWPQSTVIELKWNTSAGATQYKVELWGGPYTTMVPCNWVSGTSCWIGTMWPGTMYWHVKARNASGEESVWSDTWSFVIQSGGNPPPGVTPPPSPSPTPTPIPATNTAFDQLNTGDIILMRGATSKWQTILYGGYWTHAAMYAGKVGEIPYIAESYANFPTNRPGVVYRSIYESGIWDAWDSAIVRPKTSSDKLSSASQYAVDQRGKPYNLNLFNKWDTNSFYCSQLVWAAYLNKANLDLDSGNSTVGMILRGALLIPIPGNVNLASLMGQGFVTPDDIYHSPYVNQVSIHKPDPKDTGRQFKRTVIWAFSPVDLVLIDPNGKKIGTDPATGAEKNEVQYALYSGSSSEPEFISVQDLQGTWQLQVNGTGKGSYTLLIEDASPARKMSTLQGTTDIGVNATYNLSYRSDGTIATVPQDQTPPTTSHLLLGNMASSGWYTTAVKVTLSAVDNPGGVGVRLTEYSLDNGRQWQIYGQPFILNDGTHTVLYRSTDHVGNTEITQSFTIKVDTVPPVVNVSTDKPQYTRVEPFIVHYTCSDPQPGSGIASCTAVFNGQSVQNGQTLDLFWLNLGAYSVNARGEDVAGWVTNKSASFQLIATIESLKGTVDRLCKENFIDNKGVCNSLQQKLDAALAARNRGQVNAAVNELLALQKEVNAQTGKAIKPEAARILLMDSTFVIQSLGGK